MHFIQPNRPALPPILASVPDLPYRGGELESTQLEWEGIEKRRGERIALDSREERERERERVREREREARSEFDIHRASIFFTRRPRAGTAVLVAAAAV